MTDPRFAPLAARNAELLATPASRRPVRTHSATGVRFPRPCPLAGCRAMLASTAHRDRHLTEHVMGGHLSRAAASAGGRT